MSMQEDIREHNALVVAKNQRDNAIAEVEMTYLTQGVHIVARKLGFLTKADVQALEENVNRMILAQNEALSKKVEELSTRLEELEHAYLTDGTLQGQVRELVLEMQERVRVNVTIMQRVDRIDSLLKVLSPDGLSLRIDEAVSEINRLNGRTDHAHSRFDILNERIGKLELVLGALGRVLVPNS